MSVTGTVAGKGLAFVLPEILPVPPVKGGAVEYWVDEVSHFMRDAGYRVSVLSRPAGLEPGENAAGAGIRYLGIPWGALSSKLLHLKQTSSRTNPLRHLAKIQNVLSYGWKARALLPQADADIVYVHNDPSLVLMLAKTPGQKFVLHMHNEHLASKAMHRVYEKVLGKIDMVLCVSDYIRRVSMAPFPQFAHKFKVVDNGTDPQFFRPLPKVQARMQLAQPRFDADCIYFLYVGRLVEVKGVHILLDAFRDVLAHYPNARLIVAGSSFFADAPRTRYESELLEKARGIEHAILFTGFLPHEQVRLLYCAVDIVVMPSIWQEPAGLVLIEAMSCAACVLTTNVGGLPEIAEDGISGVVIEPNQVDSMARAMATLIEDPLLRESLGRAARRSVERRFNWARVGQNLDMIFRKL